MVTGETRQVFANDQNGTALTGSQVAWTTSTASIATVSAAGLVTAVANGAVTITATAGGKSGSAAITVVSLAFASVTTGDAHTCALTTAGAAWCWGRDEFGQLGIAPPGTTCSFVEFTRPCTLVPVAVQGGLVFSQLSAGGEHTCGLTAAGAAYCWGHNNAGQLGDNSSTGNFNDHQYAPVPVSGGLVFTSLSAAGLGTCGLVASGAAYCWGANGGGSLGDGTTTNRTVPVPVAGGHLFTQISKGGYSFGLTCGISGNAASCWGENLSGQLGIGTTDNLAHPLPLPVAGGIALTFISAGGSHVCGLTAAGAAYCWGENVFGSVGDGTATLRTAPVPVSGGIAFTRIAAGGFSNVNAHTCGLTAGGQAYCWGDNEVGAVGDGTFTTRLTPVAVTGQITFTSIDAGLRHTCGLASTGIVYCWGSNGAGQLGINSVTPRNAPTRVVGQQ